MWFLGLTRLCPDPNGISIGSAVIAQLTRVSNIGVYTQTHVQTALRATYVSIGRSSALRAGDAAQKPCDDHHIHIYAKYTKLRIMSQKSETQFNLTLVLVLVL